MKKRTIYTLLTIVCIVGFWIFENFYTPATYSDTEASAVLTQIPKAIIPQSGGEKIQHSHYMLSYSEAHEQAEWVLYKLEKNHLTYDDRKRPYFIEDPKVKTKSADWRNYKGSGYDRGHLCPAGDRRFSEQAYNETFYTSNISPQKNDFNAGIWNRLEQQVRQWAKRYRTIYVITGGVLEDNLYDIGDEDVSVPQWYYKIVVRMNRDKLEVLAFLFPHEESSATLRNFLVPVDLLEVRTGIDFFENLPESEENTLEKGINVSNWKF